MKKEMLNVEDNILVITDEIDEDEYVECYPIKMANENNEIAIIVDGEAYEKINNILEKIKDMYGGYDYYELAPFGCYIKKSMINKKNVYLDEGSFLNDFPNAKRLYHEYVKDELKTYFYQKKSIQENNKKM